MFYAKITLVQVCDLLALYNKALLLVNATHF